MSETDQKSGSLVRLSTSKEAKAHANLVSVRQDLVYTHSVVQKLIELIDKVDNEAVDVGGADLNTYWSAALIAYARCFADGKRLGLEANIFKDLPGDPLGAHQYFIDQRNKLIAHSVNPFEQVQVGFVVDDDDKVVGVGELSMKLVSPDKTGCETLFNLTAFAIQFVAKEAEGTSAALLVQGQSLARAEIQALKTIRMGPPPPEDAGKARST